jgi:nucleoside 2-deoxyribosyltransferase
VKVYVAGALGDQPRVRELIRSCAAEGHEVEFDWTEHPSDITDSEQQRAHAAAMREAVMACDVFVLADHVDARGALVELGIALAGAKPAIVCGVTRPSVFFALPNVHHAESPDELRALLQMLA